jgi:hypothetical protein
MIQYAKLPLHVSLLQIQNEVRALTRSWQPHFNSKHYEGSWTVLSLRSPTGEVEQILPETMENESFRDTPLMNQCPAIKSLLNELHCPLMTARLMNLKTGSVIKEHRDHDLAFEKGEARLHFPLFTNPMVMFHINGVRVLMHEGDCWYVNVNLPHKVANLGNQDRIHLVVDCRVNDWLKQLFAQADKAEVAENRQNEELQRTIQELRYQNTVTGKKLADELEQQLNDAK